MTDGPAGDPEDWVDRHGDGLYRYALLRLRAPDLAADAVQETFLEALRGRSSFAGQSSERTWLVGILRHKILDHFRRTARDGVCLDEAACAAADDPADALAPPADEFGGGAPAFPLGLAVHPGEDLLYVGFVTINRIGVYRYDAPGGLHFVRSIPDSGAAPCWLTVNRAGTRLYASNTGDPSVTVYDIEADPAHPVEIQRVVLRSTGNYFQFALDPGERFLHVVTQQASAQQDVTANALNVLKVNPDGTLTEVPSSPTRLPVQNLVRPQGVATY